MHDLIGTLIESVADAFAGNLGRSRGWLYVLGYFALLGVVVALVFLFSRFG